MWIAPTHGAYGDVPRILRPMSWHRGTALRSLSWCWQLRIGRGGRETRPPLYIAGRLPAPVASHGYNVLIEGLFRNRFSDALCGFKAARTTVVGSSCR